MGGFECGEEEHAAIEADNTNAAMVRAPLGILESNVVTPFLINGM